MRITRTSGIRGTCGNRGNDGTEVLLARSKRLPSAGCILQISHDDGTLATSQPPFLIVLKPFYDAIDHIRNTNDNVLLATIPVTRLLATQSCIHVNSHRHT